MQAATVTDNLQALSVAYPSISMPLQAGSARMVGRTLQVTSREVCESLWRIIGLSYSIEGQASSPVPLEYAGY